MAKQELERRLQLSGSVNFRDLGGYRTTDGSRVRTGRLYRSDSLHRLDDADVAQLRRLGVVTVYDLRMPEEIAELGTGPLFAAGSKIRRVHAPLYETVPEHWLTVTGPPTAERIGAHYYEMLELGARHVANLVRDLGSEQTYPAVIHCVAGRDRTGTVAAVLLSLLGVPDEVIETDYALTGDVIAEPEILPDTIAALLDNIERHHGSAAEYLTDAGVSAAEIAAVRAALLEPEGLAASAG